MIDLRFGWLAILAGTGCGSLISSDVTDFDLTLPDKQFTVDTSGWQVMSGVLPTYLMTTCTSNPTICNTAAQQACESGCAGECDTGKHTCDLDLQVSLFQPINLVMEKPELKTINDEPVIKVTIDSLTYEVTGNTLNVPTPPLTLFVAPMSVMDPTNGMAASVGTVPAITAGMTTTGPQDIAYTPEGKANLVTIMSTYATPFNVIVGGTLQLVDGDPEPTGKLDAVVHITAHAGL